MAYTGKRSRANYIGRGKMRISKKRKLTLRTRQMMVPRNLSYGGRAAYATMTFSQTLSLSEGTAGQGMSYAFNLNSAFDPNLTGVGNQPVGYDQMSALYRKCLVMGATVQWDVGNTTTAVPITCGLWISPDTVSPNVEAWPSMPGCSAKVIGGTNSLSIGSFYRRVNFPKEYGITMRKLLDEDDYSHGTSSNPVQRLILYVWIRGWSSAGTIATASSMIRITMRCKFTDAKSLDPS